MKLYIFNKRWHEAFLAGVAPPVWLLSIIFLLQKVARSFPCGCGATCPSHCHPGQLSSGLFYHCEPQNSEIPLARESVEMPQFKRKPLSACFKRQSGLGIFTFFY
jgi:hypothetical protein